MAQMTFTLASFGRGLVAKAPFGRTFWDYLALAAQRRALRGLEPHELQDIGVTRQEADAEAARPLWDVPSHWRQ